MFFGYLDVSCSLGPRGYWMKFQSVASLSCGRLLEELCSQGPSSCFHGNSLDYGFLPSQAKPPCSVLIQVWNVVLFLLRFLQNSFTKGVHVHMHVHAWGGADFTKVFGKTERCLHLKVEIMNVYSSFLPCHLTSFLRRQPLSALQAHPSHLQACSSL